MTDETVKEEVIRQAALRPTDRLGWPCLVASVSNEITDAVSSPPRRHKPGKMIAVSRAASKLVSTPLETFEEMLDETRREIREAGQSSTTSLEAFTSFEQGVLHVGWACFAFPQTEEDSSQ